MTPFKEDFSIDFSALEKIVEHCIQGGVDYLVVLGTTGEAAVLSQKEKQKVAQTICDTNAGRLPLVLGIGGNNTASVANELKTMELTDFHAVLSVSPYYNKPTQEGIYQHFKTLAVASPKPIVLYNVPSRTGSNMLPNTVLRLAKEVENIVAIKEASADLTQIDEILHKAPEGFLVISGDDFTALPTVMAGGAGVISVLGQGYPARFSKMIKLAVKERVQEAYEIHHGLLPLMKLIFEEGNPAGIKSVFESLGLCKSTVRLPLVGASPGLKGKIADFHESNSTVVSKL